MALDLSSCSFVGPALPEPFVKFDLEAELSRAKLLPATSGEQRRRLQDRWNAYRRSLRELVSRGGSLRVRNHVIEPLVPLLGYDELQPSDPIQTREGQEAGGALLVGSDGERPLRIWTTDFETDLDAPSRRGYAYRYSHLRIAQRVLLAAGERVGLLTNGVQLRILISDPARPDSEVIIPVDPDWRRSREVPDSFRFLLALCSPKGVAKVPDLVDKARLKQARVTKELRVQARQAIERFVQEVLDNPNNRERLEAYPDRTKLAQALWRESLVFVYRLLFILKGEASDDPARAFGFASMSLWRNTYSPSVALAPYAKKVLDEGAATGGFLEQGLRTLFRLFAEGIECTELHVAPLGGALFGAGAAPMLSSLEWGERAVAHLLDRLLWTSRRRGSDARERVHYGPLDVEDLGRVYEALLELEPGIATEPMCRLRRQKLEVVVPIAQGEKYRPPSVQHANSDLGAEVEDVEEEAPEAEEEEETGRKKTKVEWVEAIRTGQFYLRVGLGRKTSGSFYTPHSFVRFLVQETLGPQVDERSPQDDPNPGAILKLNVLDPAMGSGHFLVEACRFLGEKLYEACRACDERALEVERHAEAAAAKDDEVAFAAADEETRRWRQRVIDLPDPEDELLRYLPSRAPEGEESGLSQRKAEALCRRLVAVHCLYGVDKNPLAVELAKLSLWLESHAEGLPLTFVDHRLVVGDSLTGPFWDKLIFRPGKQEPIEDLFHQNLDRKFSGALREAIKYVGLLDARVATTLADLEEKHRLKAQLDRALAPFNVIAAAWSGGVMLGPDKCDDLAYSQLVKAVGETGDLPEDLSGSERLRAMIAQGLGVERVAANRDELYELMASGNCVPALPYDLTFPEVFFPNAEPFGQQGFDAVLGNPPWDAIRPKAREFFASYDFEILAAPTKRERSEIEKRLKNDDEVAAAHELYEGYFAEQHRIHDALFRWQVVRVGGEKTGGDPDSAKLFLERNAQLLSPSGQTGVVIPSAFHVNEGTTGIRRLYLEQMGLKSCYSFENRRQLFEIHRSFKFALVVASRSGPTVEFPCAFYLHDDEWVFGDRGGRDPLRYTLDFVRRTGGEYLTLLELRSRAALDIAEACFRGGEPFGRICERVGIRLGRELHMTDDVDRLILTSRLSSASGDTRDPTLAATLRRSGYLPVHEGKTFHQYSDRWGQSPTFCVHSSSIANRPGWLANARFFRLAYRKIGRATDERTAIFVVLPPGVTTLYSCSVQYSPNKAKTHDALTLLGICNSFPFDWCGRQRVSANFQDHIRDGLPVPRGLVRPIAHLALRLTCNHAGYAPLWHGQLGDSWREPGKEPFGWPVLTTDEERWEVRSAIDAVVADAYGLSRDQYEHVLHSFDRASGPNPYTTICLEKFNELKAIGLDAFTKKYDPYWDIPLVETLPKPVIDLPIPSESSGSKQQAAMDLEEVTGS